jgi:hypothetical protein
MDKIKPAAKISEKRELAALTAIEAIGVLATHDPDDFSEDSIELRCFAEASLHSFISICDEEQ